MRVVLVCLSTDVTGALVLNRDPSLPFCSVLLFLYLCVCPQTWQVHSYLLSLYRLIAFRLLRFDWGSAFSRLLLTEVQGIPFAHYYLVLVYLSIDVTGALVLSPFFIFFLFCTCVSVRRRDRCTRTFIITSFLFVTVTYVLTEAQRFIFAVDWGPENFHHSFLSLYLCVCP